MITTSDYVYFADRALDGMVGIVEDLGDDLANACPDLPGANSPFALLVHCLGVVEAWAGGFVAGRAVDRDRAAEFEASGSVAELVARARAVRAQFHADASAADPGAALAQEPPADFQGPDRALTQGAALQHVYEELAQHHGQMEVMRDVIRRDAIRRDTPETGARRSAFEATDPDRLRAGNGVKWGLVEPDVIPAWVADMDFGVPPAVRDTLSAAVGREDFGYPWFPDGDPVVPAFEQRMAARFGWTPAPGRTRVFTDLLQILQSVTELTTQPGDGVAIHVPSYPPFLASIERSGRRIVPLPMVESEDGNGWGFDTANLTERLRAAGTRLLVLVNPHNPTGRVFTREELRAVADTARELDLVVLADEIHADLVHSGHRHHLPFATVSDDAARRTITATSATKTFNIAGLRCAVAHFGHQATWEEYDRAPIDYFGTPSTLSRLATVAAWERSAPWHADLMARLDVNRRIVRDWVGASRHGIRHHVPEATYLAWLDFSATPIGGDPVGRLHARGRVLLSGGAEFAQCTDLDTSAWARLNFATSEDNLREILRRIDSVLDAAAYASDRADGGDGAGGEDGAGGGASQDPARAFTGGADNL